MVVIRCTQKLLTRVGAAPARRNPKGPTTDPQSTTRLGDWFAHTVNVGRQRFILLVAERTRLPLVVRARDVKRLGAHAAEALPPVLRALGVHDADIQRELEAMQDHVYAPANSRSVVGTLNEFAHFLTCLVEEEPECGLTRLALELCDIPVPRVEESIVQLTRQTLGGDTQPAKPVAPTRMYQLKIH